MTKRTVRVSVFGWLVLALASGAFGGVSDVAIDRGSFNPSGGQSVRLTYALDGPESVTVRVYDMDEGLIRVLLSAQEQSPGEQTVPWDGKDWQGWVVPDAAFFFEVETASGKVHDPTTTSGGMFDQVEKVDFAREEGTLSYHLPRAARVLSRLGIKDGPMYRTLVDWEPRVAGLVTEYWLGWDEDRRVKFWRDPGFKGIVSFVTLPDTTVITFGNEEETYRDYKLGRGEGRPRKTQRPRQPDEPTEETVFRPEGMMPPGWVRSPHVSLTLSGIDENECIPEIGERVSVRVDADPADKDRLVNDQFEVIFFVDGVFFSEAERGYFPLNWVWETHQLPPGEHVLTVNVISLKGQVGVASRKVLVQERQ